MNESGPSDASLHDFHASVRVWVRARAYATGERWGLIDARGSPQWGDPPAFLNRLAEVLDPSAPSVALARAGQEWVTILGGYATSQKRSNSPNPKALVALIGGERWCRSLAARAIAGILEGGSTNIAARAAAALLDGPDTKSFSVASDLVALLTDDLAENIAPTGDSGPFPSGSHPRDSNLLEVTVKALVGQSPLPERDTVFVMTGEPNFSTVAEQDIHLLVSRLREETENRSDGEPAGGRERPASSGSAERTGAYGGTSSGGRPASASAGRESTQESTASAGAEISGGDHVGSADSGRVLRDGLRRRGLVSRLVDVVALAGVLASVSISMIAVRAALDFAEQLRVAFGGRPPATGVDWYRLGIIVVLIAVPFVGVWSLGRLSRRRFRKRIAEVLGPGVRPIARGPRLHLDRRRWLAALLNTPEWAPKAASWRASGALPDGPMSSDAVYRSAADLVCTAVSQRVSERALATGLAVAVAPSAVGDAVATIAGSAEIQLDTLASLGLQPTVGTYLRIARTASLGLVASSYLDVEDRLELELAVRAAALGLDAVGDTFEAAGDVVDEELADAFGEAIEGVGGSLGSAVTGAFSTSMGVTAGVVRQVAQFTEAVGAQVTEGLVVASLLAHHGMGLAAHALGIDEAHRRELTPHPGRVPAELFSVGVALARHQRTRLGTMLRTRISIAARKAPGMVAGRFRRKR